MKHPFLVSRRATRFVKRARLPRNVTASDVNREVRMIATHGRPRERLDRIDDAGQRTACLVTGLGGEQEGIQIAIVTEANEFALDLDPTRARGAEAPRFAGQTARDYGRGRGCERRS